MNGAVSSGNHYGYGYLGNTGSLVSRSGYSTSGEVQGGISSSGGGNSENLQPYITCYMWKRTV